MFRRSDNVKRAVGLMGIVLALSSTFQQTHVFCFLAECAPSFNSEVAEEHSCSGHTCPHSKARHKSDTASVTATDHARVGDSCGSHSEPCPCPPACWCHQTSEPFELPKSGPEPTDLVIVGPVYMNVAAISALDARQLSRSSNIAALDSSVASAAQKCAQLCRFLT